ncbi:MAG: hypothetical protein B7X07_01660 [Actinobacteria bacterium 21-64-8]|nr:MAG: hypothetical protein B7X07_01660 [Actinobacteria bacterium 21-64-8]
MTTPSPPKLVATRLVMQRDPWQGVRSRRRLQSEVGADLVSFVEGIHLDRIRWCVLVQALDDETSGAAFMVRQG